MTSVSRERESEKAVFMMRVNRRPSVRKVLIPPRSFRYPHEKMGFKRLTGLPPPPLPSPPLSACHRCATTHTHTQHTHIPSFPSCSVVVESPPPSLSVAESVESPFCRTALSTPKRRLEEREREEKKILSPQGEKSGIGGAGGGERERERKDISV